MSQHAGDKDPDYYCLRLSSTSFCSVVCGIFSMIQISSAVCDLLIREYSKHGCCVCLFQPSTERGTEAWTLAASFLFKRTLHPLPLSLDGVRYFCWYFKLWSTFHAVPLVKLLRSTHSRRGTIILARVCTCFRVKVHSAIIYSDLKNECLSVHKNYFCTKLDCWGWR